MSLLESNRIREVLSKVDWWISPERPGIGPAGRGGGGASGPGGFFLAHCCLQAGADC